MDTMNLFYILGVSLCAQLITTFYLIRDFKKSQKELMEENENYQNVLSLHYERGWNMVTEEVTKIQKQYAENLESIIEGIKLKDHDLYLKIKANIKVNELAKQAEEKLERIKKAQDTTRFVVEQIQKLENSRRFEELLKMLSKHKLN